MKCIRVTFDNVDEADYCLSQLKNEYEFSYSFLSEYDDDDKENLNQSSSLFPTVSGMYGFVNPFASYTGMNYFPYPMANAEDSSSHQTSKKTDIRIKCRDALVDGIVGRLYNLNGRNIKIT